VINGCVGAQQLAKMKPKKNSNTLLPGLLKPGQHLVTLLIPSFWLTTGHESLLFFGMIVTVGSDHQVALLFTK
jgi:hypothetical protein